MEGIYEMDNKNNFVSNNITSINTNPRLFMVTP